MKGWMLAIGLVFALSGTAHAEKSATKDVWVPLWTASPAPDRKDGTPEAPLQFDKETVRQDMRLGASAKALRFRISNELGVDPLVIGAASARRPGTGGTLPVLFDGRDSVTIPPGAVLVSDAVALSTPAFADVSLSIWFPGPTRPAVRRTPVRISAGRADVPDNVSLSYRQNVVSAVFGARDRKPVVVVALGDSITEGATARRGTNGDWPARLADRFEKACPGQVVVLNEGISGNKVLDAGRSRSALERLDRDVIALPGVDHVIVFEGINDIRHGGAPDMLAGRNAPDMMLGYRQIATRLQQHGIVVTGATLTPFGGSERYEPVSAATRQALNGFIRDSKVFDSVIDFDKAMRDPAKPESLPDNITRDHLHPNDEGYGMMAAAVDLSLFGCHAK